MEKRVPDGENPDPIGKHTLNIISGATRFNQWMYSEIKPSLKGNILEIGSGIGNISRYIIRDGFPVTLSDYNPDYCNELKKIFSSEPAVQKILQIDLLLPNFQEEFHLLKEKFDTIILLNVIEHIENDSMAVSNCRFMLKPDGHFVALAPAYQWLYCRLDKELGHYRRYTLQKMKNLVKEQLEVINARHFNFLGIFGWFFFGKIFRNKTLGNEMNSFDRIVFFARLLDKLTFKRIGLSVIVTGKKQNLDK